jgi:hypothetical protein
MRRLGGMVVAPNKFCPVEELVKIRVSVKSS